LVRSTFLVGLLWNETDHISTTAASEVVEAPTHLGAL
jgi:hypothetical protein